VTAILGVTAYRILATTYRKAAVAAGIVPYS
jgi:hypothetical protein